jgi:hypothetical protein
LVDKRSPTLLYGSKNGFEHNMRHHSLQGINKRLNLRTQTVYSVCRYLVGLDVPHRVLRLARGAAWYRDTKECFKVDLERVDVLREGRSCLGDLGCASRCRLLS